MTGRRDGEKIGEGGRKEDGRTRRIYVFRRRSGANETRSKWDLRDGDADAKTLSINPQSTDYQRALTHVRSKRRNIEG